MKPLPMGLLVAFITFNCALVNAQTVQWAHSATSPGYVYGNAITCDDSGDVYITGQIEFLTHFDNGPDLYSVGSHDIFFGKYSPSGNNMWMRSAGGKKGDVGHGIGVDATHNVYVTGEIDSVVHFIPTDSFITAGSNDIFVSKYDRLGNYIWARDFGSAGNDKGFALAETPSGTSYVTGYYSGSINFDSYHLGNSGIGDVFISRVNTNGNVDWAKKGGGAKDDRGRGITYDQNGNVYVVGYFTESATFGSSTITTGTGVRSAFIAKYDAVGSLSWVQSLCCDTSEYKAVAVDGSGNIYVAGYFYFTAQVGSTTMNTAGDADMMLVKYDPSGNVVWAKQAGGPYEDEAFGVTVDSVNNIVYLTGQLDDHVYFGTQYVGAAGNRDVFIAAYDLNGNFLWAKPYGSIQRDIGYAITSDHNGYVMTTGVFVDSATFGNYHLMGDSLLDCFVSKVSPVPVSPPTTASTNLAITNSACSDLQLTFSPGNGTGRIIIAHEGSPVTGVPSSGTYYQSSNTFGSGDSIPGGNFIVYNGSGNMATITGLIGGLTYYFSVFEYSGTGGAVSYLTTSPATSSHAAGSFAATVQSTSNSMCTGDTVTLTAAGGGTYSWTPSGSLSSSSGNVVQAFPASTNTYTVTVSNGGCQVLRTITITVNPLPVANYITNDSVCVNGNPLTLTGGTPAGGTYSGQGVTNNVFNPAAPGVNIGAEVITYTYTDGNGCSASDPATIDIVGAPNVHLGNDTVICVGNSITLHAGSGFASYLWSNGNTHANVTIDSTGVGLGTKRMIVTVENNFGCANSDTIHVTFDLCSGIENLAANPLLKAYPNPFSRSIRINLDMVADIYVYDITGKLVEHYLHMNNETEFGEGLVPGVYSIVVLQKNMRTIIPVVKTVE